LAGLGWRTVGAFHEVFGGAAPRPQPVSEVFGGADRTICLSCENAGQVVLLRHQARALRNPNPVAPAEAIDAAVKGSSLDLLLPKLISGALDGSAVDIEIA
jgi:hypothetical protein